MHLFIVYIGGSHKQSLIELHDMRFVIGNSIEDTYNLLRQSWWGIPKSLHIDAWGCLNYADGHQISISEQPPEEGARKLYFLNLGGYDNQEFTELHKNLFVVATDPKEARQKALKYVREWRSPHKDFMYEVDSVLDLNRAIEEQKHYIHLKETNEETPFEFTCRYIPIGKTSLKT